MRACQCTFCRAHGALSTSDPRSFIEFNANRPELLSKYRFAQRTADFLVCKKCGVYIGAIIETARGRFGIVNVNALEHIPGGVSPAVPMEYGSESLEERTARREGRWSPVRGAGILDR